MHDFITETLFPVVGYFLGVTLCIGFVAFAFAVMTDIVSDPLEISWQEDAQ
jgi:hypothetical protein